MKGSRESWHNYDIQWGEHGKNEYKKISEEGGVGNTPKSNWVSVLQRPGKNRDRDGDEEFFYNDESEIVRNSYFFFSF